MQCCAAEEYCAESPSRARAEPRAHFAPGPSLRNVANYAGADIRMNKLHEASNLSCVEDVIYLGTWRDAGVNGRANRRQQGGVLRPSHLTCGRYASVQEAGMERLGTLESDPSGHGPQGREPDVISRRDAMPARADARGHGGMVVQPRKA